MSKVLSFNVDKDYLYDLSIKYAGKGNFVQAINYAKKACAIDNSKKYLLNLANIYESMNAYKYANNCYFKILSKKNESNKANIIMKLAGNFAKKDDLVTAIKYLQQYGEANADIDISSINFVDDVMNSYSFSDNIFSVVYPRSTIYYDGLIAISKDLSDNEKFEDSNEILLKIKEQDTKNYKEVIKIIVYNYIMLSEISKAKEFCLNLDDIYIQYKNMFLFYINYLEDNEKEAKEYLNLIINQNTNLDILLEIPKILGETKYYKENLQVADILLDKNPYSYTAILYKIKSLYALNQNEKAIQLIKRLDNIYSEECESYFLKKIMKNPYNFSSINELTFSIYSMIEKSLIELEKLNIKDLKRAFLYDLRVKKLFEYAIDCDEKSLQFKAISILDKIYNEDVRELLNKELLKNSVSANIKSQIIKTILFNDTDAKIKVIIDDFYSECDFSLPKEVETLGAKYITAFYEGLLRTLLTSMLLNVEFAEFRQNAIDICKFLNDKNIKLKCKNPLIISAIIRNINSNEDSIYNNEEFLISLFDINKNTFLKYKKQVEELIKE